MPDIRTRTRPDTQTVVWLALVLATVLTAVLGLEQATNGTTLVGIALLAIGFVKLRLVGIHFMELGSAPAVLRMLFEGYVVGVFTVLVVLYLAV